MTPDELRAASDRLLGFHDRFAPLFGRTESRSHSTDYVKGLLVIGKRKNVEAMTMRVCADQPQRKEVLAMQRFLSQGQWEHEAVQREIQSVFAEELKPSSANCSIGTVGVIDESGFPKRGTESVGVKRQWCGQLGKKDSCQVGVFWVGVTPAGCAMLEHQLYLPREWANDEVKRNTTHVPEDIDFQTKLQIATTLRRRIANHGQVTFDWVIGDELYGRNNEFLDAMDTDRQKYVMEVPVTTVVWTVDPQTQMRPWVGNGRPPKNPKRDSVRTVTDLNAQLSATDWTLLKLRDGTKGPLAFEFAAVRVWAMRQNRPGPPVWVVIRRSLDGEVKYYISNADEQTPLETMAQVTGARWRVEEYFEESKGELGMSDYEARGWPSWHHHMSLVALAHLYVTLTRRDLKRNTPELTLPMAVQLMRQTLPRPQLDETDALRIMEYHLTQNAIAEKSHRESWIKRHPDAAEKLML